MNGVWYFLGDEPGFGREASLGNYGDRSTALFDNRRMSRVRSDAPLFLHPQKNKKQELSTRMNRRSKERERTRGGRWLLRCVETNTLKHIQYIRMQRRCPGEFLLVARSASFFFEEPAPCVRWKHGSDVLCKRFGFAIAPSLSVGALKRRQDRVIHCVCM